MGRTEGVEPIHLFVAWVMLGAVGRSKHDEFVLLLLYDLGQIIAVIWRHVARAANRAVIVTHAGPLILPLVVTVLTPIMIVEPSHCPIPSRQVGCCRATAKPVGAPAQKVQISSVPQAL